jgi:hypothetical protein
MTNVLLPFAYENTGFMENKFVYRGLHLVSNE